MQSMLNKGKRIELEMQEQIAKEAKKEQAAKEKAARSRRQQLNENLALGAGFLCSLVVGWEA